MRRQHNAIRKTVGPRMADLLAALYDRGRTTFTHDDVLKITGLRRLSARSLISKAERRGLVSRLKPGLFVIVPPELGSVGEYASNPYLTARDLAGGKDYFLSHASAMELRRMTTQPQLVVYTSSAKRIRDRVIHGTEFRFVFMRPEHVFGTAHHWVSKQEFVMVSDPERTVIDGLRQPEYCGGITEVAKGLWMRRADLKVARIVDYALRLGSGAVIRRLGYLLDLYQLAPGSDLEPLRGRLTMTYVNLDPILPPAGPHLRRWRLRLNVPAEELDAVRSA